MMPAASNLDTEKFGKVRALMEGGSTDGERKAARAAATKMAQQAGLTLDQAVSKMDAPKQPAGPTFANVFEGFDDWMEAKEPGYKAKRTSEREERETARQAKLREVLSRYGTEEAIFAETAQETALRVCLEPLANYATYANAAQLPPDQRRYISDYGYSRGEPSPAFGAAMRTAIPIPDSVSGAWAEYRQWESLADDRYAASPDYSQEVHVRARQYLLEHILDTMPDATMQGFAARLDWLHHVSNLDFSRGAEGDRSLAAVLRDDFNTLAAAIQNGQPVDPAISGAGARRTNADKRRDVLSMLDNEPGLSDREISRRVGVSPQTVGNWRNRRVSR
jgi:hypothetical protein